MNKRSIIAADKVFTGKEWLNDFSLVSENNQILELVPTVSLSKEEQLDTVVHPYIVPAFIDIQIYGAGGKLFSVYPETDALYRLQEYCRTGGAFHFAPTVATNTKEVFFKAIDAVKEYWQQGGTGCLGLHLEGPWMNPIKRGAHIEAFIHSPSMPEVKELLDYGAGIIKIITLAPEVCSEEIIRYIQSRGIVVSAGHSNASYATATAAFDNGITTATHLFNAMSALQHREPGMVGAIFNHPTVKSSIVPDGYHVDFAAIRIAKTMMKERLFVITDAVTEAADGPYQHYKKGDKFESNGILSGSALTMIKSVKNLVQYCGIELGEAIRMCSLYPAQVLGLQGLGTIEKGNEANFILLDQELNII